MSPNEDPETIWKQTTVIIRSDIFSKALEMGVDISNELNLRLAERVGIDCRQQPLLPDRPLTGTRTGSAGPRPDQNARFGQKKPVNPDLHPVINADDPSAAAAVRRGKHGPHRDTPPASAVPAQEISTPSRAGSHSGGGKKGTGESRKRGGAESLKKFVADIIVRTDSDDAVISKDDMYIAFSRWCRNHRVVTVPDRKVFATMLKNRYAIQEKTIKGISSWIHVRLK